MTPDSNLESTTANETPSVSQPASEPATRVRPERIRRKAKPTWAEIFSKLLWFAGSAGLVFLVAKIGPKIVEEYRYASTIGTVRGEYQNAVDLLADEPLGKVSLAYQLVAQKIRPSVVSVRTLRPNERKRGLGSGVVISEDGYILTNAHVVAETERIEVALCDRRRYYAQLVGLDRESDLAVVKIEASGLIPATWGDSDACEVGSICWAIGSPYGLDQTVTSGIISGKNRRDEDHQTRELLQTDAAVNPGNSGGPLVNVQGEVIGINSSIFGETFQGISFAVPGSLASFVAEQLINEGEVLRGFLGVSPTTVFQDIADDMNLPDLNGALISRVEPGSPADLGGLRRRDVILEWDGKPITLHTMLFRYVEMTPPNHTVIVKIVRKGIPQELEIRVGQRQPRRRFGR